MRQTERRTDIHTVRRTVKSIKREPIHTFDRGKERGRKAGNYENQERTYPGIYKKCQQFLIEKSDMIIKLTVTDGRTDNISC